jgi:hypothetical protein
MSDGRQSANLWWYLTHGWHNYAGKGRTKWAGWDFFRQRLYRSSYFWHDSFGQYWHRWVVCEWRGHPKVVNVADPGEPARLHCFKCEQDVRVSELEVEL